MVTLTIRNVKGRYLRSTIEAMQKDFVRCKDVMTKRKTKLIGLRKVEVTYNKKTGEFHPHFHCIIDGCAPSFTLVAEWLKRHPEHANFKGQDLRPADDPIELFKYFTKMLSPIGEFNPKPMDTIFKSMKGKRVFQPFGGVKKLSEEVKPEEAIQCDWKGADNEIWGFEDAGKFSDWYNAKAEPLTSVEHSDKTMQLIEQITS